MPLWGFFVSTNCVNGLIDSVFLPANGPLVCAVVRVADRLDAVVVEIVLGAVVIGIVVAVAFAGIDRRRPPPPDSRARPSPDGTADLPNRTVAK